MRDEANPTDELGESEANPTGDHAAPEARTAQEPYVGVAADLIDLGRTWARHGLGIGQQALVNAARTLELTAATLERVSERLRHHP